MKAILINNSGFVFDTLDVGTKTIEQIKDWALGRGGKYTLTIDPDSVSPIDYIINGKKIVAIEI